MGAERVILVTGVADFWGGKVAEELTAIPGMHVIGLDIQAPADKIDGLDFIQADVRNPLLSELFLSENIDTVCHLKYIDILRSPEASYDINVLGTMKVVGACAEAGVRKIVFLSSMAVYGAQPGNSAFLSEDSPLLGGSAPGYVRQLVETETFLNSFNRQSPDTVLTVLRFASVVGPSISSPMARFLRQPFAPVLMGFDPQMQVIHEEDVARALVHCITNDIPGTFNVAAEGIFPLRKLVTLAGKIPLPVIHWFAYWGSELVAGAGRFAPMELDYLRYPWVGDMRKMREEMAFTPRYTAEEALREFASNQRYHRYLPGSTTLAYDEERLRDTIDRRRRARLHQPEGSGDLMEVEGDE